MRVSITEVRDVFAAYVRACESAGFDMTGVTLQEGSATYGRAFRIQTQTLTHVPGTGFAGYIGSTRAEAAHTMRTVIDTLYSVSQLN